MSYMVFHVNPVRQKVHRRWAYNVGDIDCKKSLALKINTFFMIFELYTSVVSCFGIKVITKNMTLF